jgi:hypothetical protein
VPLALVSRRCRILSRTFARYRKRKTAKAFWRARAARRYCLCIGEAAWQDLGIALSRIWEALKHAQQERSRERSAPPENITDSPADSDHRKGLRHPHIVPVLVYGSSPDKQPFHEEVNTIDAGEHGCLLVIETPVVRGQRLFLANTCTQAEQECRVVHACTLGSGKTRVGLVFCSPSPNFWLRSKSS